MPSVVRGRPQAPVPLPRLLAELEVIQVGGDPAAVRVSGVTADSRAVTPGTLFCCIRGATADGHEHAPAAVAAGAPAVVSERPLALGPGVVQVVVGDGRRALAAVAAAFHGHPSRHLRVAGVTGTNGKTTVTHLLKAALAAAGIDTAVIGTLDGARTTPEAPELQARLAAERAAGRAAVAMEVSSHALAQRRVDAVHFAVVGFTNLTQDHLDYHGDLRSYFEAKASLFDPQRAEVAVVNVDDAFGRQLLQRRRLRTVPYSLADAEELAVDPVTGAGSFRWQGEGVRLALGGRFNVSNAVCAAVMARELGAPAAAVASGLSSVQSIPGRFERIEAGQPFGVVVDYAHTPDALEQVLTAAREMAGAGRVLLVFGCGGRRDRAKRPLMGAVAARLADVAVVTSDNPRDEDPLAIIEEVRGGAGPAPGLVVEPDRRSAIELAVSGARPGDVVVIAGKGHETGQTVGDRTLAFDDRDTARAAIRRLATS